MRPKNILKIIIFSTFTFNMFFVVGVSQSYAITLPVKLFELPSDIKNGYIDTSESPEINVGENNKAKVCRDVSCENPEIINFEISENNPLIIDSINGLSGKVWGGELGWIVFNPPYGGVTFADIKTGLLKGIAWSETSGAINFSVTGQKVVIDPKTGEWNGWAWASGPYGGWVKFDCNDPSSCVRTTWRNEDEKDSTPTLTVKEKDNKPSGTYIFINQTKEIIENVVNDFYNSFENLYDGISQIVSIMSNQFSYSFVNLFDGTTQLTHDTFSSLFLSFINLNTLTSNELAKINNSAFITSAHNIKNVSYNIIDGIVAFGDTTIDLFNKTTQVAFDTYKNWKIISNNMEVAKNSMFDMAGDGVYESYSLFVSSSLNLKATVLLGLDDLFIQK